tara:strand:+ start:1310 stop:2170 length:861 start_codon:yes stop_codon:yes gene_type:complete
MNKYINCINYLVRKKTQNIAHNNTNFFQHHLNVFNKLRKWQCSEDICYAGLFHSIYSNEVFNMEIEKDREIIKNLIGQNAESLVYSYSKDRFKTKDLRIISLANHLDQNFIKVIDNYFDQEDIMQSYFHFRDKVPWKFIGSGQNKNTWRNFRYYPKFKNKIELKFKKSTEKILKNFKYFDLLTLERIYASGNPYGTVHESHTDYGLNSQGGITVMYYLNNTWDLNLGGETVFYDVDRQDIQKSVIPKPGRIVIFDGLIEHCARETVRKFNDLRMVLTFKYEINVNQ